MRRIILLASAFLLIPASAFAAFDTGDQVTISGTATSYDGRDATVLAQRPSGLTVVDINESDSTGNIRRYAQANLKPKASPTPSPSPTPTPTSTPTPAPTDTPAPTPTTSPDPTPSGVTLRDPDGGLNYYAQFAKHGPLGDASYFPMWLWGQYDFTPANVAKDKSEGFNGYYGSANDANENPANIADGGMWMMGDSGAANWQASPGTIGYRLGDEADMNNGPGWDALGPGPWPNDCVPAQNASPAGQCGYTLMRQKNQQYPADGRARIMNYSKGVAFWESDAEASTFVNGNGTNYTQGTPGGFQNIVSADNYWFTDSDLQDTSQGAEFYGHGWGDPSPRNLTFDEAHRAYNYALTIKRVRDLDAMDGQRQPVFGQIEMGWWRNDAPSGGYALIKPAEMRAAFWQSIIGGARGIVYFPFSFAGAPCGTQHHTQRDTSGCYSSLQAMATDVNGVAKQLAPVINGQFADGFVAASAGVDVMAKLGPDGHYYVFAGSKDNAAKTATFSVASGANAVKVGETTGALSIPVTGGQFSDDFADGNAIHIYRIDA